MGTVDKKDYVIQALTQQRDAANNEIARIIAEANEQIGAACRSGLGIDDHVVVCGNVVPNPGP